MVRTVELLLVPQGCCRYRKKLQEETCERVRRDFSCAYLGFAFINALVLFDPLRDVDPNVHTCAACVVCAGLRWPLI